MRRLHETSGSTSAWFRQEADDCVIIPVQLGWTVEGSPFIIENVAWTYTMDGLIYALCAMDILFSFRTTFYDEDHQINLDASLVATRYRKGWFRYDLLSSLPFIAVPLMLDPNFPRNLIAIIRVPRLLRLLRLRDKLFSFSARLKLARVFIQMFFFILVAHWAACLWWMIGVESIGRNQVADRSGTSWLRRVPPGSTQLSMNTNTTQWSQQYLSSMYWSLTTLMKTPWIGPDTVLEKVFCCICVVLGATLFATLLGNVTALVSAYDKRHAELRDRLTTLHSFASFRRVPMFLQRKMLRYVDAHWKMTAGLDHNEILQSLPSQMRGSVILAIHGSLLHDCPLLRSCSEECAKTILLKAKPQVCLQKESLLEPGALCTELYVLITGALQITLRQLADDGGDPSVGRESRTSEGRLVSRKGLKGDKMRFRVIEKPGQVVGVSDPFLRPTPYPFHVTALKTTQMIYISRQELADVVSVFGGEDADNICKLLHADFNMSWETLKPRTVTGGQSVGEKNDTVCARTHRKELNELRNRLEGFESRLDACLSTLSIVQVQSSVLPQMQQRMQMIIAAHPSRSDKKEPLCA